MFLMVDIFCFKKVAVHFASSKNIRENIKEWANTRSSTHLIKFCVANVSILVESGM